MSDVNKLIQILNRRESMPNNDPKKDPKPKDAVITPLTHEQKLVSNAMRYQMYQNAKNDSPYELSQYARNLKIDPTLTCIGGACEMYKNLGLDFSAVGDEYSGVRDSVFGGGKVVEYNPTFAKNYSKAGFEKLLGREASSEDLQEIIKNGNLAPGDLIQYLDEKGIPKHTNTVYKVNPDGTYVVYNSWAHNTNKNTNENLDFIYTIDPSENNNKKIKQYIYRLSPQAAANLTESNWGQGGKIFEAQAKMGNLDNYEIAKKDFLKMLTKNWGTYQDIFKVETPRDIPSDVLRDNVIYQMTEDYEKKSQPGYWAKAYHSGSNETLTPEEMNRMAEGWKRAIERVNSLKDDFGVPIEQHALNAYKRKQESKSAKK